MTNASRQKIGTVLVVAGVIGGCGRPRAEPPVAPDSHASAGTVAPSRRYAEADVRFMQRMIDQRFMNPEHANMWKLVESPEEVLPAIRDAPKWREDARSYAVVKD
jgi:hypothetical protein